MISETDVARNRRGWVMLQSPGVNAATFGVLIMLSVHLAVSFVYGWLGERALFAVYMNGGLSWQGVGRGQVWQLLTHLCLHGSWPHLLVNAFLFYYAAARLSHVLSAWRIVLLFLVCGIGAGLAHLIAQIIFPVIPPVVGASGGVTGLLLAFFAISPDSRMVVLNISARNLSKGVLISSALLFVMTPWLEIPVMADLGHWLESAVGDLIFRTAHLVHFTGGLLGWVLIGRFFPRLLNSEDLTRMRLEREARVTAGTSGSHGLTGHQSPD